MKEYTGLLMACDEILTLYKNEIRIEESDIHAQLTVASREYTRAAIAHLVEEKCIKHDSISGNWYLILGNGSQLQATGGYKAQIVSEIAKTKTEEEKRALENEKLKLDLKNAKRIFKTYWWTFGFAVAALLISLILLLLRLVGKEG